MAKNKRLFVLVGKPGHGKTYISNLIKELTCVIDLETDKIRRNYVVDDSKQPSFSPRETKRTYDKMFDLADEYFNNKSYSVVLDGTFVNRKLRERAIDIGGEQTEIVKVVCLENEAKKRLEERNDGTNAVIYNKFRLQPLKHPYTIIDNSGSREETEKQIRDKIL